MTKPLHILIVEDNDDDVVLIEAAFTDGSLQASYDVVRDGEEAMTYLRHEAEYDRARRPDLILLDINMPRKNGFEVLDELKQDPELKYLPVIMLTTSNRDSDILQAYAQGAASYLVKPQHFDELRAMALKLHDYWGAVSRLPEVLTAPAH